MNKKRILILCPYPEDVAPSQRLKFEQYYDCFRKAGFELTISPFISPAFWNIIYKKGHYLSKIFFTLGGYLRRVRDLFRIRSYDIIYVHLWATPLGPPLFEKAIRKMAKKIVFDIDDLVYLKDIKSRATPLISKLKGAGKPIYLIKTADHVITCTPYLDSFVRQFNTHSTDISSTVNTDLYIPRKDYAFKEMKIVLGWSGSLSTSKYLHLIEGPLKKLKEQLDFKLLVMGDKDFLIPGLDIEATPWAKSHELTTISRFDIGLYPLPDEEWVYGKSGLKAIQYMAMGIPTLATAIGANYRVIENEVSGFLITKEDEWVNRTIQLVNDIHLRKEIGQQARKRVEEMFSIKANESIYLQVLTDVLVDKKVLKKSGNSKV